ncbi:hypothetical protein L916_05987 [Phytophthora nicotianae]|uniref:Uncharacterized protein n=1 Tax=Phytophthora nicotianae TaxID=4792 RepID=W2JAP1_PHYNI|nr:hypothetical protein L916_05987 [Phytophthora nicotianae]
MVMRYVMADADGVRTPSGSATTSNTVETFNAITKKHESLSDAVFAEQAKSTPNIKSTKTGNGAEEGEAD